MLIPTPLPRWIDAKRTHPAQPNGAPARACREVPTVERNEGVSPEEAGARLVAALLPKTLRAIRENGRDK